MIAASPESLIAAATAFSGLRVDDARVIPDTFVDRLRRQVGAYSVGHWDTALIYHWGYWSHFDAAAGTSSWALPPTPSPDRLAAFAELNGMFVTRPRRGDVYVQYSPARRGFVRSGVIAAVLDQPAGDRRGWDVISIEGNSGPHGELCGPGVERVSRRLSSHHGDRFIRWSADADARDV